MKSLRLISITAVSALALFVASCTESPTAPTAAVASAEQSELLGGALGGVGLLICQPLPAASASGVFGPAGGSLQVGPHELRIPAGALTSSVLITATAPTSSTNRVEFQPHGLQFQRSAELTMSYANCNTLGLLLPKRVAYVSGQTILEFLPSLDNLFTKKVTGRLEHFSEYAVAW